MHKFIVSILLVLGLNGLVGAVPTLQIQSGILLGVKGISVEGILYDVQFLDGACGALYSGCDAQADFLPMAPANRIAAANALLNQVLLNVPQGAFDSNPALTRGCTSAAVCNIIFPFELSSSGASLSYSFNYGDLGSDAIGHSGNAMAPAFETTSLDTVTWAVWSVAAAEVPEPGSLALLGAALLAACAARRRAC